MSAVTFLSPVQEEIKLVEERMRSQADESHADLRVALEHLLAAGGKRIRPTLSLLVGNMLDAPLEKLITLGAAVEVLHTATLVHDDLIDGSLLRRGMATLNARWSPPATVLTGDFLFARAAKLAAETDHLPLMQLFSETLATIVNGELTQMFTSRGLIHRENYEKRIYAKTASLLAIELLHAVSLGLEPGDSVSAWPSPLRTLDQTLPAELPDSIIAAVRVGFRGLSHGAQQVLAAMAVLPERAPEDLLERATGLPAAEVRGSLDALEWQRWVTAESRGYTFVARIVKDIVKRDMLTAGQRRRIEEAVGGTPPA